MPDAIHVDGLREFNKALKELDAALPKLTRLANNEAADLVVSGAKPRVPRKTGAAAGSMRKASTRTSVRVRAGGPRAKHYPWLDFGGRVGRRRSVIRPFMKEGRYLYDTYFRLRDSGQFVEVLSEALADVARQAGLEVTDG